MAPRPTTEMPSPAEPDREQAREAQELSREAATSGPQQRHRLQLDAVARFLDGGYVDPAARLLGDIPQDELDDALAARWQLLAGRLDLARRRPAAALERLDGLAAEPELAQPALTLVARAHEYLDRPLEAARARIALAPHLEEAEARQANREATWASLLQVRQPRLATARTRVGDDFAGWVELARLAKGFQTEPQRLQQAVASWQGRFDDHPANPVAEELSLRAPGQVARPREVAVLLPLSGRYADAGGAVRDGLLAAWFQARQRGRAEETRLSFHDTAASEDIPGLAEEVVAGGAEMVIGPLRKDAVAALAGEPPDVPVLALNSGEDRDGGDRFHRFGLEPEAEAVEVADRLWRDGHSRAAMLRPRGDWGERMAEAFEERWQDQGGEIASAEFYDPEGDRLAMPVKRLLGVDASQQRFRDLRSELSAELYFEPRHRQDIDAVFLAAFPEPARQIPPQLRFQGARELPIYGTSHLYAGRPDPDMDSDLEGVRFADSPWALGPDSDRLYQLQRQTGEHLPDSALARRLHGLGIDAWLLLPRLALLRSHPEERVDGATGTLRLDEDGRIRRDLWWARFEDGRPRRHSPDDDE
ncbi:MAG: penicillin-binding protein activator [Pseudomonadota bacterium]